MTGPWAALILALSAAVALAWAYDQHYQWGAGRRARTAWNQAAAGVADPVARWRYDREARHAAGNLHAELADPLAAAEREDDDVEPVPPWSPPLADLPEPMPAYELGSLWTGSPPAAYPYHVAGPAAPHPPAPALPASERLTVAPAAPAGPATPDTFPRWLEAVLGCDPWDGKGSSDGYADWLFAGLGAAA